MDVNLLPAQPDLLGDVGGLRVPRDVQGVHRRHRQPARKGVQPLRLRHTAPPARRPIPRVRRRPRPGPQVRDNGMNNDISPEVTQFPN